MNLTIQEVANRLYISKQTVRKMIKKGSFPNVFKSPNDKFLIPEEDILPYEDSYRVPELFQREDYLTSSEVAKVLSYSVSYVNEKVKKGKFPGSFKYRPNTYLIPKTEVRKVERYLKSNELLDVNEAAKILNISKATLWKYLNKGDFPNAFKEKEWRIPIQDIKSYLNTPQSKIEEITPLKVIEEYKNRTTDINSSNINRTKELFEEFVILSISSSRASEQILWRDGVRYAKTLSYLRDNLYCEIFLMNDNQLEKLIENPNLPFNHKLYIAQFLNFCSSKIKCEFKNRYNVSQKKQIDGKDLYGPKTFQRYYEYVQNVDLHLDEAIKIRTYCRTWLFVIMHMINAWRPSDIIKNLPHIDIEEIGITTFSSLSKQKLSFTQAQTIINQIYNKIEKFYVSKTGALGQFLCNRDMIIPTATVLILAELHRRKNRDEFLLQTFIGPKTIRPPDKELLQKFFQHEPELINFQSRKMSRSLLTHYFDFIVKFGEDSELSYDLARNMRSHMDKTMNSTATYIQSINTDGSLDKVSLNLFKRGHFGWLYNYIIELSLTKDNDKKQTLDSKTAMIQLLEEEYTPIQLEGISHFLIRQQQEKESIALKLATIPQEELQKKLQLILRGEMPARMEHAQCFIHGNCIKLGAVSCIDCYYVIPKVYVLFSIELELIKLIESIKNSAHQSTRIRDTHLLFKILELLKQANNELGKDYVKTFIDTHTIKKKIQEIKPLMALNLSQDIHSVKSGGEL